MLKRHVNIAHNGRLFNCDKCRFTAAAKYTLDNHILVQHEGKTFDCAICQNKSKSKTRLDYHIKINHEGLRYECHECDRVFTGKHIVRRHVESVHKGLKYGCDMCEAKFSYPDSVSTHKKNVHFKETFYGPKTLTETVFSMMIELKDGWKCIQCGKEKKCKEKGASKNLLKMHIESEHMEISHICEMCGNTYKTEDTFENHLNDGSCRELINN